MQKRWWNISRSFLRNIQILPKRTSRNELSYRLETRNKKAGSWAGVGFWAKWWRQYFTSSSLHHLFLLLYWNSNVHLHAELYPYISLLSLYSNLTFLPIRPFDGDVFICNRVTGNQRGKVLTGEVDTIKCVMYHLSFILCALQIESLYFNILGTYRNSFLSSQQKSSRRLAWPLGYSNLIWTNQHWLEDLSISL